MKRGTYESLFPKWLKDKRNSVEDFFMGAPPKPDLDQGRDVLKEEFFVRRGFLGLLRLQAPRPFGAGEFWSGYVAIEHPHPLWGEDCLRNKHLKKIKDVPRGCLSFSGILRFDPYWYIGFDTNSILLLAAERSKEGVRAATERLIDQIADLPLIKAPAFTVPLLKIDEEAK